MQFPVPKGLQVISSAEAKYLPFANAGAQPTVMNQ